MQVRFSVPFVQGLQRPRFFQGCVIDPSANRSAKQAIAMAYKSACMRVYGHVQYAPAPAVVRVCVATRKVLPKSKPKKVILERDTFKPDIDNVIKLVLDALNGVAYDDDAQVVSVTGLKHPRERAVPKEKTTITVEF